MTGRPQTHASIIVRLALLVACCGLIAIACEAPENGEQDTGLTDTATDTADRDQTADVQMDADTSSPPLEGCQPLAEELDCLLPFPSDFFRAMDATGTATLSYGPNAARSGDFDAAVNQVHPANGFSPGSSMVAVLPAPFDDTPLTFHDEDISATTALSSPTLIIDAETGALVPHFAEKDVAADAISEQILFLRPLAPLEYGRRYLVVLQHLTTTAGDPMPRPAGFAQIAGSASVDRNEDPDLADVAERYRTDLLPHLERLGVTLADVTLAWDFTVRTREDATRDMFAVRDQLLSGYQATDPVVSVVSVEMDVSPQIARRIELSVEVPLFVDSTEPGATLNRDAAGNVVAVGTGAVPFTVWIPTSVLASPTPSRIVQYGHGFLGERVEADTEWLAEFADTYGLVIVAADWWGMSRADVSGIIGPLSAADIAGALSFTDRVHQAMANKLAIARAIKTSMLDLPDLQAGDVPVYDPQQLFYYGISQGHILGGTYAALSPDIERFALGVGGASFSFIMGRAAPFQAFVGILAVSGVDRVFQQKFIALSGTTLDRIDPLSYASFVRSDPYPGNPTKEVLIQVGLGDSQVPNLSAHMHARALGIPYLAPAVQVPPLVDVYQDGDSAFVEFDFGLPLPRAGDYIGFSAENDVHEGVRRLGVGQQQVDAFLRTDGNIVSFCDGLCDPE